jgi:hypothetical protein
MIVECATLEEARTFGMADRESNNPSFVNDMTVLSKCFVKKQPMQWTPRGAHLRVQIRTKVLNDDFGVDVSPMALFVPASSCITPPSS